jgi:hypothetical protein
LLKHWCHHPHGRHCAGRGRLLAEYRRPVMRSWGATTKATGVGLGSIRFAGSDHSAGIIELRLRISSFGQTSSRPASALRRAAKRYRHSTPGDESGGGDFPPDAGVVVLPAQQN